MSTGALTDNSNCTCDRTDICKEMHKK
uniref:Uncharacterized protein n=1 Tax=Rhizophora mucronata TaxID=61149 RepID=A0A2P2PH23_RHIMU